MIIYCKDSKFVIPSYSGKGNVSITATSAHSIHLSHNLAQSGVYYLCNVTTVEGKEKTEVNNSVTTHVWIVTGLLPDTTYRVDCVAYNSDGVEYCLEANTTVTTRELIQKDTLQLYNFSSRDDVPCV